MSDSFNPSPPPGMGDPIFRPPPGSRIVKGICDEPGPWTVTIDDMIAALSALSGEVGNEGLTSEVNNIRFVAEAMKAVNPDLSVTFDTQA